MDKQTDIPFFRLLTQSYRRLIGEPLVPPSMNEQDSARWLYESVPFIVLAHDTSPDPVFIYGNKAAQRQFEYEWDELIGLPSRLSAATPERDERQAFIERVAQNGFATNYRGLRIAKSGQQFWIENATLWQLIDDEGRKHGLAARVATVIDL